MLLNIYRGSVTREAVSHRQTVRIALVGVGCYESVLAQRVFPRQIPQDAVVPAHRWLLHGCDTSEAAEPLAKGDRLRLLSRPSTSEVQLTGQGIKVSPLSTRTWQKCKLPRIWLRKFV